jgi:lipopolysaccharide transport system ATP-binding protein
MDGNEGKNLHGFSGISKLEVNFSFASDPALPCPTAALVISNENGRILGSTMSQRQCVLTRDLKGKGLGYVSIDKIGMNRGNYRLGVYLFCERGLHGYAMIDPVTNFSLENIGTEQGLILLASSWR